MTQTELFHPHANVEHSRHWSAIVHCGTSSRDVAYLVHADTEQTAYWTLMNALPVDDYLVDRLEELK